VEEFVRESRTYPLEDLEWLMTQSQTARRLWFDCIMADDSGQKFSPLHTTMNYQSFRKAKLVLDGKLFEFAPIIERQGKGRPKTIGWKVRKIVSSED
jgi:hypothetical protein